MKRDVVIFATGLAWLGLVVGGVVMLEHYKSQPGAAATAPATWPADSLLPRPGIRPALVVFAHPQCPCTAATLTELARLGRRLDAAADVHVLFVRPDGADESWRHTKLWEQAATIPGAQLREDLHALEARRFGSETSGQVLLYAASGELQFAGGITSARGHEGDNPGADRIVSLVQQGRAELAQAPVFGCPLHDEGSQP